MALTMKLEGDRIVLKWNGREVLMYEGSADEVRQKIPSFKRKPFATGEAENKFLDVIVRKPLKDPQGKMLLTDDEAHIPIAIVSKTYGLVRHRKLFKALRIALENIVSDPQYLEAKLMITEYGERMRVSFRLHHYEFDPGDGYPLLLQVNALNSVDRSTSLDINMTWYRHASGTSLIYRMEDEFSMRHVKSLTPQAVEGFLSKQLRLLSVEHHRYREWYRTKRSRNQVERWISDTVEKKWGTKAADRVLRIAATGQDEKGVEVPKIFAPVQNLYHLSQVLSWVAKWTINEKKTENPSPLRERTLGTQLERMMEIPALMDALLEMEESPTQIEF